MYNGSGCGVDCLDLALCYAVVFEDCVGTFKGMAATPRADSDGQPNFFRVLSLPSSEAGRHNAELGECPELGLRRAVKLALCQRCYNELRA